MANATMALARGAESVTLPAPAPGYDVGHRMAQAVGQTAAGDYYVYDKELTDRAVRLVLELTPAQKAALIAFVTDTLVGSVNTFTWTDHQGADHDDCRLRSADLAFRKLRSNRFRVVLEIVTAGDVS